jgi:hypothetical protein
VAYNAANIDSPDVLKEFRSELIKFEGSCRQAVFGVRSDLNRALQWLQHDQLSHWKEELRKSNELVLQTRSQYILARHGADALRKPSYVEEAKALRKAEMRKDEAERKIMMVKKWAATLEQQGEKLMGPINQLSISLDTSFPQALARLEIMIRSLEDYFRDHTPVRG